MELTDFEEYAYKILGGKRRRVLEMPLWKGTQCGWGLACLQEGARQLLVRAGSLRGSRGLQQRP